ncbi:HYC_CC_PP family protein [Sunxiuqinia dokdonensis]|uniref:HYC_CC_PP family protein n=1 Tax=Sunxiuqinia dokdonensis TaxID=1409788 RepID=UPI00069D271E|nr:hypothetical protein [Sunxiuqinia dokdonensis]
MPRKISHILLSFLLLLSTMGMVINLHYCENQLYDVGIFFEATNCCIENSQSHHHENENHHKHIQAHHDCNPENHAQNDCDDETVTIEPVDNFVASSFSFDFDNLSFINLFLLVPVITDLYNLSAVSISEIPELNIPPPKIQTILSNLQVYRL